MFYYGLKEIVSLNENHNHCKYHQGDLFQIIACDKEMFNQAAELAEKVKKEYGIKIPNILF